MCLESKLKFHIDIVWTNLRVSSCDRSIVYPKKLEPVQLQKILKQIETLQLNPRPMAYKKLSERDDFYRIVYTINDREILVVIVKVAHRREVYR